MVSVNFRSLSWRHLIWIIYICLFVFGLPFIFSHVLGASTDLYNVIYLTGVVGFIIVYRRFSAFKIRPSLKSGWALGSILAIFIGLGFFSISITGSDSLARSLGNADLATVIWRGIVFGLAGGIMISTIPFVVVWRSLAGDNPGRFRRFTVAATAMAAMTVVSVCHSVGTIGFNGGDVEGRLKENIIAGLPTLISGNPLAAPVATAFLSVSEIVDNQGKQTEHPKQKRAVANNQSQTGGVD